MKKYMDGTHNDSEVVDDVMYDRLLGFQHFILQWYQQYGRLALPWRQTSDAYAILVSELMLQQTQVERVIPKYQAFLGQFPTLEILSQASLADVLSAWQGLGYNRRAKFLWQLAQQSRALPLDFTKLQQLPGIGPYTAAAVCVFADNQPLTLIETNVRTVFLYHFFPNQQKIADAAILPLIAAAVPSLQARDWYSALMDYGSYLKSVLPNPSRASKQHVRQSRFVGSRRQLRGAILRLLLSDAFRKRSISKDILWKEIHTDHFDRETLESVVTDLVEEGMLMQNTVGELTVAS